MTKAKDDNNAGLQDAWTTGHAAAVTSPSQAGIEVAADDLRKHTVVIGKTADTGKGFMQAYQQMALSDTEFAALEVKS